MKVAQQTLGWHDTPHEAGCLLPGELWFPHPTEEKTWGSTRGRVFIGTLTTVRPYRDGTRKFSRQARLAALTSDKHGYQRVWLRSRQANSVHRVVLEALLNRPLAAGEIVNHRDSCRHNNLVTNLELVTYGENNAHRWLMDHVRYLEGLLDERGIPYRPAGAGIKTGGTP